MPQVLFMPLNTNHVLIFQSIIASLKCDYEVLCHDRISESKQYFTEEILKRYHLRYRHYTANIIRSPGDSMLARVIAFLRIRALVRDIFREINPAVVVMAIDNDPISSIFVDEARSRRVRTVLIQEALIRPHELTAGKKYLAGHLHDILRRIGIYLSYAEYGASDPDVFLVSGKRAFEIYKKKGFPERKMAIVGQTKYDEVIGKINASSREEQAETCSYLFAASTTLVNDEPNKRFLRNLTHAAKELGIHLMIKMHPRTPLEPSDVTAFIDSGDRDACSIVKSGDDTSQLLSSVYGFITVSSTVVLEALMMDKECIVVDYLAGMSRLDYGVYDAVHVVSGEEGLFETIKTSLTSRKPRPNKMRLLEDELFKLDGKAGARAAQVIDNMVTRGTDR